MHVKCTAAYVTSMQKRWKLAVEFFGTSQSLPKNHLKSVIVHPNNWCTSIDTSKIAIDFYIKPILSTDTQRNMKMSRL